MKKWALAAILYLTAVIGGYTIYDQLAPEEEKAAEHMDNTHEEVEETDHGHDDESSHEESNESSHEEDSEHAHGENATDTESEVVTTIEYNNGNLELTLKDTEGNPVDDLEVNHEKLLHLIVVGEGLEEYYHLHPEKVELGKFKVNHELGNGTYKAFIDIKPKDLSYSVTPLELVVGSEESHSHAHELTADKELTQTVDNETVKLNMSTQSAGVPTTLSFELNEEKLEPYLGAMGHVVILDENADKYLHVHPLEEDKPLFETSFEPGIYKIWAEFKQDGKVRVFPYIVEIK